MFLRKLFYFLPLPFLFGSSYCYAGPSQGEEGLKEANGTSLYYKVTGQGEPVLVIHGGPGLSHQYLFPHLEPLSQHYKLIFYDQRASGRSSLDEDSSTISLEDFIEDIEALRKEFGIEKLNLLAHSWGGILAMKYAVKYPARVKSIVLVSSIGAGSVINAAGNQVLAGRFTRADSLERAAILQTEAFRKRESRAIEQLMMIGFRHQFYEVGFANNLQLSLDSSFGRSSMLLQYLAADLSDYDFHEELKAITAPVLLVYGTEDPLAALAGERLYQSIPGVKRVSIENSGHFPFIEKQKEFTEEVTRFIAKAITPGLRISRLTGQYYIYTTYKLFNGTPFPSNSMYLVTDKGAVLFDTPWDTTQFQPLLDSISARHQQPVVLCISTHYHDDRTAGVTFFKQRGIPTYSSQQTYELCVVHNEQQPAFYFTKDTSFTVGGHSFQTFYPGAGHTADNIVIWFEKERILYGGCLVKSTENSGLGNIADADLTELPKSVRKIIKRFPAPDYVIPGHFDWKDNRALQHTLKLLEEHKGRNK